MILKNDEIYSLKELCKEKISSHKRKTKHSLNFGKMIKHAHFFMSLRYFIPQFICGLGMVPTNIPLHGEMKQLKTVAINDGRYKITKVYFFLTFKLKMSKQVNSYDLYSKVVADKNS